MRQIVAEGDVYYEKATALHRLIFSVGTVAGVGLDG